MEAEQELRQLTRDKPSAWTSEARNFTGSQLSKQEMNNNDSLTELDLVWLNTVMVRVDEPGGVPLERPVTRSKATTNPLMVPSLLVDAKLSPETMRREEIRLMKLDRKRQALRNRKKRDKRKRPWTAKQATQRRVKEKGWAEKPYSCMIRSGGSWQLDKELWSLYIQPLWDKWLPKDLIIKRYRGYGNRKNPYTIYTMDVIHKEHGLLYNGNSQLLYDLGRSTEGADRTGSEQD